MAALASLAAASHAGGCGSWYGFGVWMRSGKCRFSLSHENRSDSHMATTISTASFHWTRDSSVGGTPKAICSIGVDRPVPHSTRPWLSTSTVATFSAMRAGWVKPNGVSVTPKPSRRFRVVSASPPSTASGVGQAERPSRKWCSTHHTVWKPSVSANWISAMASS